jgi:hypothetical protein
VHRLSHPAKLLESPKAAVCQPAKSTKNKVGVQSDAQFPGPGLFVQIAGTAVHWFAVNLNIKHRVLL